MEGIMAKCEKMKMEGNRKKRMFFLGNMEKE
jgi:hypothetical protein